MSEVAWQTGSGQRASIEFDPELPKSWSPAAQQRFLDIMSSGTKPRAWYCRTPGRTCDGKPHGAYDYPHARSDQWPPDLATPWMYWLMVSGRGGGKTRSGAEFVRKMTRYTPRIALVAPTAGDLRDTMVEGESGLLRVCEAAGYMPHWEPSKRRLTFPNGAIATGFSAEEPDRLRGPNHGAAWCDEAAHWPNVEYVWDMLAFGLRLKDAPPRVAVTTTPKPSQWLHDLIDNPATRTVRVSTFANKDNLAPAFVTEMRKKYEGTRMGRQELYGELLEDVAGALWSDVLLEQTRRTQAPTMVRVAVGVDPAGTNAARSDETGIVVVGLGVDEHVYILDDLSGRYSPTEWAQQVWSAAIAWDADLVVAETNYGGQMVREVLRAQQGDQLVARLVTVNSRKGKLIRAEPVFSLFEQDRAHMVGARMGDLENQLCSWVPGTGKSPDRLDAMVHAVTVLMGGGPARVLAPSGQLPARRPQGKAKKPRIRQFEVMRMGVFGARR